MRQLTVTPETFTSILSELIQSNVTFEAKETSYGIEITFTGGY